MVFMKVMISRVIENSLVHYSKYAIKHCGYINVSFGEANN